MNWNQYRRRRRLEAEAAQWVARNDAGLSARERAELERWLSADPSHSAAFKRYDSAWSALGRPGSTGSGALLEAHVRRVAARRRRRTTLAGFAAAAVAVLFIPRPDRPAPAPPSGHAVVVTPKKQILPDGSVVELREDAHVTLDFQATHRRVVLERGTAFFAVESDPQRPFTVEAAGVKLRAVGTEFAVQVDPSRVEVVVSEGTVLVAAERNVSPGDAPAPAESRPPHAAATVSAGSQAVVEFERGDEAKVTTLDRARVAELLAWRSLRIEFTRTPLAEAVRLLNAHAPPHAPRLAIGDERIGAKLVSGVFRPDNIEAFVHLLEPAFGIQAREAGGVIHLHAGAEMDSSAP